MQIVSPAAASADGAHDRRRAERGGSVSISTAKRPTTRSFSSGQEEEASCAQVAGAAAVATERLTAPLLLQGRTIIRSDGDGGSGATLEVSSRTTMQQQCDDAEQFCVRGTVCRCCRQCCIGRDILTERRRRRRSRVIFARKVSLYPHVLCILIVALFSPYYARKVGVVVRGVVEGVSTDFPGLIQYPPPPASEGSSRAARQDSGRNKRRKHSARPGSSRLEPSSAYGHHGGGSGSSSDESSEGEEEDEAEAPIGEAVDDIPSVMTVVAPPNISAAALGNDESVVPTEMHNEEEDKSGRAGMPPADVTTTHSETAPEKNAEDDSASDNNASDTSKPLRTLKKLQAMLDETDYATQATLTPAPTAVKNHEGGAPVLAENIGRHDDEHPVRSIEGESVMDDKEAGVRDTKGSDGEATSGQASASREEYDAHQGRPPQTENRTDRLWTSKDRSKYRRQQRRQREEQKQRELEWQRRREKEQLVQHPASDDDATDFTDDGLGYTLPNLPVYISDGEPDEFDPPPRQTAHQREKARAQSKQAAEATPPVQQLPPQMPVQGIPYQYQYPYNGYNYQGVQQPPPQPQPPAMQYPGYVPGVPFAPPPPYGVPPGQHYGGQYAAWAAAAGAGSPPYVQQQQYPYAGQQPPIHPVHPNVPPPPRTGQGHRSASATSSRPRSAAAQTHRIRPERSKTGKTPTSDSPSVDANPVISKPNSEENMVGGTEGRTHAYQAGTAPPPHMLAPPFHPNYWPNQQAMMPPTYQERAASLAEAGTNLSFDSLQKLLYPVMGVVMLCYCAVSPRTLPVVEYNRRFKQNLQIVCLILIAPAVTFLSICDATENDVNSVVHTFYTSFTMGYIVTFLLEIVLTTILRLGVFAIWEPDIFQLTPTVPLPILPWALRENKYKPKRITLFAADFVTSCVASSIVEEYIKLKAVQWSVRLPRNFKMGTRKKNEGKKSKRKKTVQLLEPIQRNPGEPEVTNINSYVTHMLASSLGMKLADSIRRAMMYTKESNGNKGFYAFCRGIFPIHELCGTLTALQLAKRDVLGVKMPLWIMLFPAVFIHGMANFRGMKPIFKWNSETPWSEMQMLPLNLADDSTFFEIISKGFAKLVWISILARVLGSCIKNYYMIGRQSVKLTTTYAENRAAFAAELEADALLKKSKDDK